MSILSIDIETYSDIDLQKSGVYAYTASPNFQILLFAYAFDEEEIKVIDLASGEKLPLKVREALTDDTIIKAAFNATFERVCISKYLNMSLKANCWRCTAVLAASLSLPLSLDGVAKVLGLKQQKLSEGKALIKYFSLPCKPTKENGYRRQNGPWDNPEKWSSFKDYCRQDVEVERSIRNKLKDFSLSDKEQAIYVLDQEINDRGISVDLNLVNRAIRCDELYKEEKLTKAQKLTGLDNPNSVQQLKGWLLENGVEVETLSKKTVAELLKEAYGDIEKLLNLRQQLAKTSIKKYEAIKRSVCPDERVRGLLQFNGANRSGRWAGRLIQVQNLPQNHLKDLTLARSLVKVGNFEALELLFPSVSGVLSELIRTAFIPKPKHRFIVADFSAIEARVIAWLAGERWRMEVFSTHGKIYEASASEMFKVPIEEITKGSALRQKGKIAELALGYGGSVGALTAMGALDMGVKEEELSALVSAWRHANPNITKLWWDIDKAAIKVVKVKVKEDVGRIKLFYDKGILFITLPSGRKLSYIKPKIEINKFGREGLTYEGIGASKKWKRIETYGPKLVENIVQAIARDLLAEAMIRVSEKGYDIVMHVHDEIVVETDKGEGALKDICDTMAVIPKWASGLILRADGYECEYYKKD